MPDNVAHAVFYCSGDRGGWPMMRPGPERLADPNKTLLEVIDDRFSGHQNLTTAAGMSVRVKVSRDLQLLGR